MLENVFNEMGIELLYTPVYSPDLNPAENVFSKVKNLLNFYLSTVVHYDIKLAVNEAVNLVSSSDMHGFIETLPICLYNSHSNSRYFIYVLLYIYVRPRE